MFYWVDLPADCIFGSTQCEPIEYRCSDTTDNKAVTMPPQDFHRVGEAVASDDVADIIESSQMEEIGLYMPSGFPVQVPTAQ